MSWIGKVALVWLTIVLGALAVIGFKALIKEYSNTVDFLANFGALLALASLISVFVATVTDND